MTHDLELAARKARFHLDALFDDGATAGTVPAHIAFRDYMDACMFDPAHGYYAAGRVKFGKGQDYWTFPVRMSPHFGALMARRVLEVWRAVRAACEAADARFHLVEVGGGMGHMLVDALAALTSQDAGGIGATDEAKALVARLEVLAVDRSPALLGAQGARQSGLAVRHVNAGAEELSAVLPRPFFGVVMANELLTQMSVDVVRIARDDVGSLHVLPWIDVAVHPSLAGLVTDAGATAPGLEGLRPLRADALPALLAALAADEAATDRFARREGVRWSGVLRAPAPETAAYLDFAAPVVARVRELGLTPTWVTFLPALSRVVGELAAVLGDARGGGAFITVDYGGTAQHVFDRGAKLPHLRTFNVRYDKAEAVRLHDPFRAPGAEDMTTDLDFSWLVHLAEGAGLALGHYAHQAALETGVDLWVTARASLIAGRKREGYGEAEATLEAWRLLEELRGKGGFRFVALTSPSAAQALEALGESDPVRLAELPRVPATIDADALGDGVADALEARGLANKISQVDKAVAVLRAGGSVVDDLADHGYYPLRRAVLAALAALTGS